MEGLMEQSRVKFVFSLLAMVLMLSSGAILRTTEAGSLTTDTQALRALFSGLNVSPRRVSWPNNGSACDQWQGVVCNPSTNRVESLRLPGVGLVGQIPDGILGSLTELRILSLHSNKLSGPLPSDLSNCTQLRSIFLQKNAFSGSLPPLSTGFPPLVRLNLAFNNFSGMIPSSYSVFHRLGTLYLQNNSLSGTLPDFVSLLPNLTQFSVANNSLNGSVSATLQKKFNLSAFEGNKFCGKPLFAACPKSAAPTPAPGKGPSPAVHRKSKKWRTAGYIAAIVVGAVAFVFFIIACCVVWCLRRRESTMANVARGRSTDSGGADVTEKAMEASKAEDFSSAAEMERNKLVFFEGGQSTFDLEDLLRASAEVLGKGSMGTAYKATLEDGSTVVVKRLKDVSLGRKEFEQYMVTLGTLRHRHVVPLRAYYYSKDEKLLLFEYMPLGSLSSLIHGNKGSSRMVLDWDTRVRIATGAAKGLVFLHEQGSKFTHGNIKSSNVLLSGNYHTSVSDFGLAPLFGANLVMSRISGYRAPEVLETRKITQKADVYSFGVLLLELLTGKAPMQTSNEEGIDLLRWVQSVVREEWTAEVFDAQLIRYPNIEEEMVQILQIAMSCVAASPDQRPTMSQVVKMIEDVRAFETDDTNRQSSSDKSRESNSHTPQRTATP